MRLARIGKRGQERPAISVDDERWFDVSDLTGDVDGAFLESGLARAANAARAGELAELDAGRRFGPPLRKPGKIVCVGLNYRDHAAETGADIPSEPILFLKSGDTVVGPNGDVVIPRSSAKTDWEVELAVVIGQEASYLRTPDEADKAIAGFAISNDVSEREFQLERGGQWEKGKNCATFNPLGPWIRTADEVMDMQRLRMRLWVNGELHQDGCTADMIFGVRHLVWYISQFMTLYPGDVRNTGTPAGVALGRPEVEYLRPGDVMDVEIDDLGHQRQQTRGA